MHHAERFGEPVLALADVLRARVVRAVGEPQRDVARAQLTGDVDALAQVGERLGAHRRIGVAHRAVLVALILEQVRVDGAGADAVLPLEGLDARDVADAARQVPQHVQGQRRAGARERVHLRGVGELLLERRGRRGLQELAESRAGIGKAPRRQLDGELVEGGRGNLLVRPWSFCLRRGHRL